ncbi:IS630 family transposase [Oscillatoria acuminata]|uniref:Transposase n=1 Tax=Oscillatoria acuminata PCC 6304 TaxID=56110 RepID=K9TGM7_9CYAN|nr:IS630 family transposase [Oscillatoria acuminata]AFY81179.1 transposase [Oscillatoria acuminata PCC 6304]AFY84703.1 transposase [Oscillatoria acuminata PCC 6304]AFY85367.1 transposase [Oscillatoria acuminata PCC 6304]
MGARLRVFLTPEEDRTLFELRMATTLPQRVKDRASIVRLNAHGWYVEKIASHFNWSVSRVRDTLHRWEKKGLGGLWDKAGRGSKAKWQDADIAYVEECLRQEPRTYNSKQLAKKLAAERQVYLSPDRLRRVLKKKGIIWKRTRISHKNKQDPEERSIKQADLDMLEFAAAAREIDLKYLDESGFCLWSSVGYTYFPKKEQKCQEQTRIRGRRLSILGIMQPKIGFTYGLAIGSFTSKSYIKMMEIEAEEASKELALTGRIRVIVQDNGPIHKSLEVQNKWPSWEEKGLYIFLLPKYCSEMNEIELEWQHLKRDELAGRMFEDELDLAYAVMAGVEARSVEGNYTAKRVKFKSGPSP